MRFLWFFSRKRVLSISISYADLLIFEKSTIYIYPSLKSRTIPKLSNRVRNVFISHRSISLDSSIKLFVCLLVVLRLHHYRWKNIWHFGEKLTLFFRNRDPPAYAVVDFCRLFNKNRHGEYSQLQSRLCRNSSIFNHFFKLILASFLLFLKVYDRLNQFFQMQRHVYVFDLNSTLYAVSTGFNIFALILFKIVFHMTRL